MLYYKLASALCHTMSLLWNANKCLAHITSIQSKPVFSTRVNLRTSETSCTHLGTERAVTGTQRARFWCRTVTQTQPAINRGLCCLDGGVWDVRHAANADAAVAQSLRLRNNRVMSSIFLKDTRNKWGLDSTNSRCCVWARCCINTRIMHRNYSSTF